MKLKTPQLIIPLIIIFGTAFASNSHAQKKSDKVKAKTNKVVKKVAKSKPVKKTTKSKPVKKVVKSKPVKHMRKEFKKVGKSVKKEL